MLQRTIFSRVFIAESPTSSRIRRNVLSGSACLSCPILFSPVVRPVPPCTMFQVDSIPAVRPCSTTAHAVAWAIRRRNERSGPCRRRPALPCGGRARIASVTAAHRATHPCSRGEVASFFTVPKDSFTDPGRPGGVSAVSSMASAALPFLHSRRDRQQCRCSGDEGHRNPRGWGQVVLEVVQGACRGEERKRPVEIHIPAVFFRPCLHLHPRHPRVRRYHHRIALSPGERLVSGDL